MLPLRKKKSSAVPLFRSGHMSVICARLSKGKGVIHKRVETAGVYPLVRRAASAHVPRAPQSATPPLRFSEKLSARQGRTRLRQFASPTQTVLKNSRPSGTNTPAAVRVPRSAGAEKRLPPVRGEPACGSSCTPLSRRRNQKSSTLFRVLLRITNAYAFLINASRRSRPLSISVSEVA